MRSLFERAFSFPFDKTAGDFLGMEIATSISASLLTAQMSYGALKKADSIDYVQ